MSTAVTLPLPRFLTRQDCERMAGEGSLDYDRFELIEGALIPKVSKNHPHSIGLVIIMEWLQGHFRGRRVAPETAIDVDPDDNLTNEPQPRLIVLNRRIDEIDRRPQPRDIVLVVEIADTTLAFDLGAKARARGSGSVKAFSVDEAISPLSSPQATVRVKDLLRA